jgi:hypothetical protein
VAPNQKQKAEEQHSSQVGDEARREDQLPDLLGGETGFDHDPVDDCHRRRRQGEPGNLGRLELPAEQPVRRGKRGDERRAEADCADRDARPKVAAKGRRIDLGAGEERQQDRSERRRKSIQGVVWRPRKFPPTTATVISMSATETPMRIETRLATSARPIHVAAMMEELSTKRLPGVKRAPA